MLSIEKKEDGYLIKKDGHAILERFYKIKSDVDFNQYYLGYSADKSGGVVLFSNEGDFVYKFTKVKHDVGVSKLLDDVVSSENIITAMMHIPSLNFWADQDVARALRYKHSDLNAKRLAKCKDKAKVDVLYDVEKSAIEKFLMRKQNVKTFREATRSEKTLITSTKGTKHNSTLKK